MRTVVLSLLAALSVLVGCASAPQDWKPLAQALSTAQVASTLAAPAAPAGSAKLNGDSRIAVESAFDAELQLLLAKAENKQQYVVNGRSFTTGRLAGHNVVMFLSGGSIVNAAMTTQQLLDHFNVERIVFSGIAGGVDPDLKVGDVTVPTQWAEYQENLFARENPDGSYAPPGFFKPGLAHFGMMYPQKVSVTRSGLDKPDATEEVLWFKADGQMLETARTVASTIKLSTCTADKVCLDHTPQVRVGGNGVSGPTFVDNAKYRQYVWQTWQAEALDMESAAVTHVAYNNGVPFIIFRSLSDLAGGGPGENEIGTFFKIAADNSASVLLAFLQAWPAR